MNKSTRKKNLIDMPLKTLKRKINPKKKKKEEKREITEIGCSDLDREREKSKKTEGETRGEGIWGRERGRGRRREDTVA